MKKLFLLLISLISLQAIAGEVVIKFESYMGTNSAIFTIKNDVLASIGECRLAQFKDGKIRRDIYFSLDEAEESNAFFPLELSIEEVHSYMGTTSFAKNMNRINTTVWMADKPSDFASNNDQLSIMSLPVYLAYNDTQLDDLTQRNAIRNITGDKSYTIELNEHEKVSIACTANGDHFDLEQVSSTETDKEIQNFSNTSEVDRKTSTVVPE